MPLLSVHHFPTLPDIMDITFEHGASHKRCVIKRKQVPIEPGFAITAHKAQGQTLERAVVDLAGCLGTEQPYVMTSRCTSIEGLVVLRDFEFGQITKRHSEDLRKEFARLDRVRLLTIVNHGAEDERRRAKDTLDGYRITDGVKKRKRADGDDAVRQSRLRV